MTVEVSSGAIDAAMAALDRRSDDLRAASLLRGLDAGDTGEVDVHGALFDLRLRWRDYANAACNQSYYLGRHIRAIGQVYFDYDAAVAASLPPIEGQGGTEGGSSPTERPGGPARPGNRPR